MWGWLKVVGKVIARYGPAVVGAIIDKKGKQDKPKDPPPADPE